MKALLQIIDLRVLKKRKKNTKTHSCSFKKQQPQQHDHNVKTKHHKEKRSKETKLHTNSVSTRKVGTAFFTFAAYKP